MDARQIVEKTCRLVEPELEKILNLTSLDNSSLEKLNLLLDTKKNAMKIEKIEMEKYSMMGGYSNHYPIPHYPTYETIHDRPIDMGYSRGDDTRSYLEMAMRNARDDRQREEIRQLLARM